LTGAGAADTVDPAKEERIPLEASALSPCRPRGWIVVSSILAALCAPAPSSADDGGLVGWVESSRGVPVAGAVVSIFGKGIRGGNLVTLSDSQGQIVLPSLPPGSYTLRAIGTGHEPSAAQHVTVLPNRDSLVTVSLTPVGEKSATGTEETTEQRSLREWLWLMRHKRRSVLETETADASVREPEAGPPAPSLDTPSLSKLPTLPAAGPVDGTVELVASSDTAAVGPASLAAPSGLGALRLSGRLADGVRWSLGGLVAENEGRAWRMAAEFVLEPGGAHEIKAGAGYGSVDSRTILTDGLPQPERTTGSLFAQDTWRISPRVTATAGGRYTYIGFLPDAHHGDAIVAIELTGTPGTVLRGAISARSLAPGGDLLTLSTVAATPAITWARFDESLRPSRTARAEIGVVHRGGVGHFGAQVFQETTRDVLLTNFVGSTPIVRNAGDATARGFGVSLGGHIGRAVDGSLTYSYGRGRHVAPFMPETRQSVSTADFHDLVARLSAMIDATDTRLTALWRVNTLADRRTAGITGQLQSTATRFDVQLTQGLPFLEPLTRADWELLLAVRNMFYEASQGGFLDELAVQDPPTRVVGGVAVRF
jgi:hypothetical protein